MAELADALDLGSSGESRAGSTPVIRIVHNDVSNLRTYTVSLFLNSKV